MEQLTEMDYGFIQMESSRTPMHITPVIFYDQSAGKVRFRDILDVFRRNLHKSRIFRRKLAGGAMGLDTPYWVEDSDFDLEFHVRHIALPKPGDWRQLCILMSRLHARGLDMSRPLWEAYVIEGLHGVEGFPPDSFALMIKVHHAAIDGVSGAEIITALHSLTPDETGSPENDNWQGESPPSAVTVWRNAWLNGIRRPLRMAGTLRHLAPGVVRASRLIAAREDRSEFSMQPTRFNARISSHRVTDALVLDLGRIKELRQAVPGATINDVIVAVVSGALRSYLLAHDELPDQSLTCGAPVNLRSERSSESKGNQVGMMTIDMATNVADPLERLKAIMQHSANAKETTAAIGPNIILDVTRSMWPQVTGLGLKAASYAAIHRALPMPMHTIISNVPGPQVPLYLAGARAHLLMGLGPLFDMSGLFHAVISGMGKISINFMSCREILPDPEFYKQCLEESWQALESAAAAPAPVKRRRRAAKR